MARRHGQNGRLYVDITAGASGQAVLVAATNDSKRSFVTDTQEVTAYEDGNKVYVGGKPDASATYAGFVETTSDQLWFPSRDGLGRKFYDYVDIINDPSKYWFGSGIFDFSVDQGVAAPVSFTSNMKAASSIGRSWV